MASISLVTDVNVSRQTSAVTVAGYSLAMFLGKHKGFTTRYKVYSSIEEVGTDFATNSPEYEAASSTFGQTPSVDRFAIGRIDSTTVTYTPVVANSAAYSVVINGTSFSIVSDSSATATEIVTALIAAINAGSEPVTASGTTTLILTADVGGVAFSAKASTSLTPAYGGTESITDALNAVILENNDWYGLQLHSHVKADQLEAAAFAQAAKKFYKTSSQDANIINQSESADTTSVAKAFKTNGYDRAGVIYGGNADAQYPEAAYMSVMFGYEPGSVTMNLKGLVGDTVDNLTTTQINNALSKNAAVYLPIGGSNNILSPTMGDMTFDDIIRDLDYAASDLQVSVFSVLKNAGKIPMTDVGIAQIEGAVQASVSRSASLGIFDANDITITVPKLSQLSANDRALRKLTGIKVVARMAGSIHFVQINLVATI